MKGYGHRLVLVLVLLLAWAVRLYDLTDPPLDFHPVRQLKGAITARYLYYRWNPRATPEEKEWAEALYRRLAQLEPPLLDALVAVTYLLLGREALWVARVYTSFFWVLGGLGLYLLARRWMPPWPALVGPLYFLFLPFAVMAGRAFQPDPGMVMLMVWSVYAWVRWVEEDRRGWAVAAVVLSTLTVVVKAYAVLPLAGALLFLSFLRGSWRETWRTPWPWLLFGGMAGGLLGYYGLYRGLIGSYTGMWTLPMMRFWTSPMFYVRWGHTVIKWLGGPWLLAAVLGYALNPRRGLLTLGLGWVLGYGAYAFAVPYQAMTHNYYHLPLMPWIALGVSALAALLYPILLERPLWARVVVAVAVAAGVVYATAASVRELRAKDYRAEPTFWKSLVEQLPEGRYIGLLQDFGFRMNYYGGRGMDVWPTAAILELQRVWKGEPQDAHRLFREKTEGYDYFLVTAMGQWEQQPALREILTRCYPVVVEGEGFLVFDLRHPLSPSCGP